MLNPKEDVEKLKETWQKIEKKAPVTSSIISSGVIMTKWALIGLVVFIIVILLVGLGLWLLYEEQGYTKELGDKRVFVPKSGRVVRPVDKFE